MHLLESQKMNQIKRGFFLLPCFVAVIKIVTLFVLSAPKFDLASFFFFSAWVIWVCAAFGFNKNIPAYSGNFKFDSGLNQVPRLLFAVTMVAIHLVVALVL
jgi:hypothetical protein